VESQSLSENCSKTAPLGIFRQALRVNSLFGGCSRQVDAQSGIAVADGRFTHDCGVPRRAASGGQSGSEFPSVSALSERPAPNARSAWRFPRPGADPAILARAASTSGNAGNGSGHATQAVCWSRCSDVAAAAGPDHDPALCPAMRFPFLSNNDALF